MKIKKFTGTSFQQAFDRVKEELGTNAVILNSRKIKEGGILDFMNNKEVYEITAAVDEADTTLQNSPATQKIKRTYNKNSSITENKGKRSAGSYSNTQNRSAIQKDHEIKILQEEIKDIKKVLNNVADFLKYSRMPALPDNFKQVLKNLIENDVHEDLAKAIVQTVYSQTNPIDYKNKTSVRNNVLALLNRMIKVAEPLENIKRTPYVAALVGPTGVGKTTTIAKLAANLKLYNHLKVALVSADTYRIAAIEQLQTFANIAGISMSVTYSYEDMQSVIKSYRDYDVILIDTVGRSQKNEEHLLSLSQFIDAANPDEVHLVLSLTSGLSSLLDIVRNFRILHPNRVIFTKLDEAIHTGNIINFLYKFKLPVSYFTTGQVVPNDIITAEKSTLANLIYKGVLN